MSRLVLAYQSYYRSVNEANVWEQEVDGKRSTERRYMASKFLPNSDVWYKRWMASTNYCCTEIGASLQVFILRTLRFCYCFLFFFLHRPTSTRILIIIEKNWSKLYRIIFHLRCMVIFPRLMIAAKASVSRQTFIVFEPIHKFPPNTCLRQ